VRRPDSERLGADGKKNATSERMGGDPGNHFLGRGRDGRKEHATREPLICWIMVEEAPLAGLFFFVGQLLEK